MAPTRRTTTLQIKKTLIFAAGDPYEPDNHTKILRKEIHTTIKGHDFLPPDARTRRTTTLKMKKQQHELNHKKKPPDAPTRRTTNMINNNV